MKDCKNGELFCTTEGRYGKDVIIDIPAVCAYLRKQREKGRKRGCAVCLGLSADADHSGDPCGEYHCMHLLDHWQKWQSQQKKSGKGMDDPCGGRYTPERCAYLCYDTVSDGPYRGLGASYRIQHSRRAVCR